MSAPQHLSKETVFEKRRGVSRVEVRAGFAQVHVARLAGDVEPARLRVLSQVADAGISIDFLKLTPTGLSFLVSQDRASTIQTILENLGVEFTLRTDRAIVLVHAVNIRDEEGMIASIMQRAIESGASVDHVGDMHDRLLLVVPHADSDRLSAHLKELRVEGTDAN